MAPDQRMACAGNNSVVRIITGQRDDMVGASSKEWVISWNTAGIVGWYECSRINETRQLNVV